MNSIPTSQNDPGRIRLLAAQRHLYSNAKTSFLLHAVAVGPVAAVLSVTAIMVPAMRPWSALWGLLVVVADFAFLTPFQEKARATAAGIQEQFDCEVLQLPWNSIKAGPPVAVETIAAHARAYDRASASMPPLGEWYPPSVGTIPLYLARLVCQRANCWWDAEQRRRYSSVVVSAVTAVIAALCGAGIATGLSVEQLILSVLAPLSPLVLVGARQAREHRRAADRLDRLRGLCDSAWSEARDRAWSRKAESTSRTLQDEILECRRRNPPVLDFVFKRLRGELERDMSAGADALVREVRIATDME